MSLTYCGTAIIDKELHLRNSDEAFFDFVGQNIYGSVLDFIHEGDVHRFQTAFGELLAGLFSTNVVVVRKRSNVAEDEWLLIEMTEEPFRLDKSLLVRICFYAFKKDKTTNADGDDVKDVFRLFFELTAGTMLIYDRESGILDISEGMEGQTMSLYHGTLEKWKSEIMAGKVADDSISTVQCLCEDLASAKRQFEHEFVTGAFSSDGTMYAYRLICRSYQTPDGSDAVLGCIQALGDEANAQAAYVMDAGLPVLSKRSIVEYAKNAFNRNPERTYLVIVDLDDFKTINDTHGHLFGDEVLVKLVKIINNSIGRSGMLGRIGGDEFMIVLNWVESPIELRNILRSIRTGVEWAFKEECDDLHVTCSIGAAAYPDNGDTYDKVFQLADRMLYIAKSKGKNRYVIYTPELHDDSKVATEKSTKDRRKDVLRDDKTGVILRLIEEFMVRKIVTYEAEFREVLACFELDRITMVYSNMAEAVTLEDDIFTNVVDEKIYCRVEEGFLESFDKNNLLVMNGRFNIEASSPNLCALLEAQGIESALFYKMAKGEHVFGYVMFAKKNRRQQWSEYEKTLLSCVGKAFELSFTGK